MKRICSFQFGKLSPHLRVNLSVELFPIVLAFCLTRVARWTFSVNFFWLLLPRHVNLIRDVGVALCYWRTLKFLFNCVDSGHWY